ncbi:MAG: FAD-binding oxidoreductase [Solirubrobacteraceae bacterium]
MAALTGGRGESQGGLMRNGVELVERGEEQWNSARASWNLAIDLQPAVVARPRDGDEVAAVVRYARERGLRVAVQAEGHGAGPLAGVGEDTLLLKTGRMTGAEVDVSTRRARVGAGAKWQDVSALASPQGLSGLSGSSAEVGVVGYTLGGGHGWLARKHGLACNSVIGPRSSPPTDGLCASTARTSPTSSGRCAVGEGASAW